MTRPTLFVQECPTCGRRLLVRIELLGRTVACQHCQAQFLARDSARLGCGTDDHDQPDLLERAQALLEQLDAHAALDDMGTHDEPWQPESAAVRIRRAR